MLAIKVTFYPIYIILSKPLTFFLYCLFVPFINRSLCLVKKYFFFLNLRIYCSTDGVALRLTGRAWHRLCNRRFFLCLLEIANASLSYTQLLFRFPRVRYLFMKQSFYKWARWVTLQTIQLNGYRPATRYYLK